MPRRKLPVDDDWRPIGLHYDVLPLKVVMGENGRAIAAKNSRQDMLIIPSLVGHPLAVFEKVYPNNAVDQFALGCKRFRDLVGAPRRREHFVQRRSAGNVAEVARVLQLPELIEVGPKGPGDGGFASPVQAAPHFQKRRARHILHDDVCDGALLLSTLVDGVYLGDRHRRGLCHVKHVMGFYGVDMNAELDDESLLHPHEA